MEVKDSFWWTQELSDAGLQSDHDAGTRIGESEGCDG